MQPGQKFGQNGSGALSASDEVGEIGHGEVLWRSEPIAEIIPERNAGSQSPRSDHYAFCRINHRPPSSAHRVNYPPGHNTDLIRVRGG